MYRKLVSLAACCLTIATLVAAPAHAALYSFSSHTFTSCGTSGRTGPAQTTCRSAYSTAWDETDGYFTVVNGIQNWTVPVTGRYYIDAYGAGGGGTLGGGGARIADTFNLYEGEVIKILVGQTPATSAANANAGGGATFVVKSTDTSTASILVIAGGGGGTEAGLSQNVTAHASITSTGNNGSGTVAATDAGAGGTNGSGGSVATLENGGGAGGGYFTDGARNTNWDNNGGSSFLNGGFGGLAGTTNPSSAISGGFGGGGAAAGKGIGGGAGGGGGYSGGGGGNNVGGYSGGGGGSYFANGLNINRITTVDAVAENTNGSVTITLVGTASISLSTAGSTTQTNKGQTLVLTANAGMAGTVTFFADGKRIAGCISKVTSGGNVTCTWKATVQKPVALSANLVINGSLAATTTSLRVTVIRRSSNR